MSKDSENLTHIDEVMMYNAFIQSIIKNDDGKYIRDNINVEEMLIDLSSFSKSVFTKLRGEIMKRLGETAKKLGATINMRNNQTILDSMTKHLPDPDRITIQADKSQMLKITKTVIQVTDNIILSRESDEKNINPEISIVKYASILHSVSNGIVTDFNKIVEKVKTILDTFLSLKVDDEYNSNLDDIISDLTFVYDLMKDVSVHIGLEMNKHDAQINQIRTELDSINEGEDMLGNAVTRLISTLKNIGSIVNIIDTAMMEIAPELGRFKNTKNIAKISKHFDSKTLNDQLYNHEAIVGGGWGDSHTGGTFDMTSEFDEGSEDVEEPSVQGGGYITAKTPEALEKAAKKERARGKVKEFVNEMNVQINKFVESISKASEHIGVTNYDLNKVEDSLENMKYIENLRNPNIYLSLVGYYLDDTHKMMASQYKDKLNKSINSFKEMGKKIPSTKKDMTDASGCISEILRIVDHFHDILKTILSATSLEDIKDIVSDIPQSMGNITLALNRMYHALHISQMRRNIRKCGTDLNRYSEQYPELLSWAVGNRRRDLDNEHALLTAEFASGPHGVLRVGNNEDGEPLVSDDPLSRVLAKGSIEIANCSVVYKWRNMYKNNPKLRKCLDNNVRGFEKFLKEIDDEFRAKHRLYKALESLDLILSAFTKELVKDVDLIKEVKKYLDDTKVYTKWFTDYTGDLLASVFESMPAYISDAANPADSGYKVSDNDLISKLKDVLRTPSGASPEVQEFYRRLHRKVNINGIRPPRYNHELQELLRRLWHDIDLVAEDVAREIKTDSEILTFKNAVKTLKREISGFSKKQKMGKDQWEVERDKKDREYDDKFSKHEKRLTDHDKKIAKDEGVLNEHEDLLTYHDKMLIDHGQSLAIGDEKLKSLDERQQEDHSRILHHTNRLTNHNNWLTANKSEIDSHTNWLTNHNNWLRLNKSEIDSHTNWLANHDNRLRLNDIGVAGPYPPPLPAPPPPTPTYAATAAPPPSPAPPPPTPTYAATAAPPPAFGEEAYYPHYMGGSKFANISKDCMNGAEPDLPDHKWAKGHVNFSHGCPESGSVFGNPEYNTLSQDLKNPIQVSFYYKQLCNAISQAGGKPIYGKATGVACMNGASKVRRNIDEFYNNFQALKNIFHSFITLYNRIVEKNIKSKSVMTPSQIYYSILSYLKQSALARRRTEGECHNQCGGLPPTRVESDDTIPGRTTWETKLVGMIMPAYYPTEKQLVDHSITGDGQEYKDKNGTGVPEDHCLKYRDNISQNYRSVYEVEDRICSMGIKSVASAVLSCMGLFTISQQPVNVGLQRTVRGILGGGQSSTVEGGLGLLTSTLHGDLEPISVPKVHDDAFASYYYVIRLAEFYKLLFKNLKTLDNDKETNIPKENRCQMRMPNNLEGEFGKILYVVNEANETAYNDNQIRVLVSEINKLYGKYNSNEDLICAFVKEVNRTFSCLVDEEAQKKFASFEQRLLSSSATRGIHSDRYDPYGFDQNVRSTDQTGSMPFDDEDEDDANIHNLDKIITPSDSMGKSITKYLTSASLTDTPGAKSPTYLGYDSKYGSEKLVKERALSKYKFCGEYKLYHKLALLRTELDKMFDEYLRSKVDCTTKDGTVPLKHYPLNTDKYREDHHREHIDQIKLRLKGAGEENSARFKIAMELMNNKTNTGDVCYKGQVTRDSLFLFSETTALMTDALFNARNLLQTTLKDIAIYSGDTFYAEYGGEFETVDTNSTIGKLLGRMNAADAVNNDKTISECYHFNDPLIVKSLYYKIVTVIIRKMGGVKLLGLGCTNQISKMKNSIRSIWKCKSGMRPHEIAISKVAGSSFDKDKDKDYDNLNANDKAQLIIHTINQVILRFELSPIHATIIGTVTRLSSALGGVVSTTISTQGTYMDVTPLQSLLIDCLSEVKQLASRFYDQFPKGFMASYYHRSDPDSGGDRSSLYDIEYDLTTVFESHYYKGIKRSPLIASSNEAMTNIHVGLVGDISSIIYGEGDFEENALDGLYTLMVKDNCGGNAIMSAIMPTHYEPNPLSSSAFTGASASTSTFNRIFSHFMSGDNSTVGKFIMDPIVKQYKDNKDSFILEDISNGQHMDALLPALNYGIKSMITSFYDYASGKIYKGILDAILETKLGNNIKNINTSYPDVFDSKGGHQGYIHYGIPNRGTLLVTSTSLVIRSLFTSTNEKTHTLHHVYESLAEMRDLSLVDTYKLKLPMFREFFLKLVNKCRVLRGFLTKGCGNRENKGRLMNVIRPWARVNTGTVGQQVMYNLNTDTISKERGNWGNFGLDGSGTNLTSGDKLALTGLNKGYDYVSKSTTGDLHYLTAVVGGNEGLLNDDTFYADSYTNAERYGYFMEMISNIEDTAVAIANRCDTMLKEFVQNDRFMIPSTEYLTTHGKKYDDPPFTPLSLISIFTVKHPTLHGLHELDTKSDTNTFQLQFGARGVLYSDNLRFLNEKYIGGALTAIKHANQDSVVKIDASAYLSFIKRYLSLFRFNFSVYDYSQVSAISGNYRDTEFRGGMMNETKEINRINRLLDVYETSYDHIPGTSKYNFSKRHQLPVRKLAVTASWADSLSGKGDIGGNLNSSEEYTVRKIIPKVAGNIHGIWLVDWIVNYVTGHNVHSKMHSLEIYQENMDKFLERLRGLGGKERDRALIHHFVGLYQMRSRVFKGRSLIEDALRMLGTHVITLLNDKLKDEAILNLNERSVDSIMGVAKKFLNLTDNKVEELTNETIALFNLDGVNTGQSDMQNKMNYIYQWYVWKGHMKIDEEMTLGKLCSLAYKVDIKILKDVLENGAKNGDDNKDVSKDIELLRGGNENVLQKYNLPPPPLDDLKVYEGIHADKTFKPTKPEKLSGGALTDGSLYNLMQRDKMRVDSNLIYTSSPNMSTSLALEIIVGQDLFDLKGIITDNLGEVHQPNKKSSTCGNYAQDATEEQKRKNLISILIELNVNPINVHSLQRFIPFANIYNYSYTLERFIYTLYDIPKPWHHLVHAGAAGEDATTNPGQQVMCFKNIFGSTDTTWGPGHVKGTDFYSNSPENPNQIDVNSSYYANIVKETFLRLMMDPYAHVDQFVYGAPVGTYAASAGNFGPIVRMMRGFDMLGMGVPKFLSDQVLCKPLLDSMFLGNKRGPTVRSSTYNQFVKGGADEGARHGFDSGENMYNGTQQYHVGKVPADDSGSGWPAYHQSTVGKTTDFDGFNLTTSGVRPETYQASSVIPGQYKAVEENLTFYDPDTKDVLTYDLTKVFERAGDTDSEVKQFRCEGYERFNTQLIRNVIFITNLQRLMRYTLNLWLTRAHSAVAHNHRAISSEVTERRYGSELPTAPDNEFRSTAWI